jgi:fumarylacetoacetase
MQQTGTSWVEVPPNSDFTIHNIPFGVIKPAGLTPRAGTAIGNYVLDLQHLHTAGYFKQLNLPSEIFNKPYLNDFFSLGRKTISAVRNELITILSVDNQSEKQDMAVVKAALYPMVNTEVLMPVRVLNYTDFYSSEEHASNVGSMFRDPKNPLLPNWKHLPVGYHGRASSIVVSGTPVHRPRGQVRRSENESPVFSESRKLDFELETAFITCGGNALGDSIPVAEVENYIAGFVLFNDWSARDIQQWEYVPLGPFLGKNFASTISPWVVTLDALEPFRTAGPKQSAVLPYLSFNGKKNFDVILEVFLELEKPDGLVLSRSNMKYLYWNVNQQLAHHTINGCNVQVGDLYASGTISGPSPGSYGSLLELSWNGQRRLSMPDGTVRTFLEDGDTVILRGHAVKDEVRVGFGECRGKILPAKPLSI